MLYKNMVLRLSDADSAALATVAGMMGVTATEAMRLLIRAAAAGPVERAGAPRAQRPAILGRAPGPDVPVPAKEPKEHGSADWVRQWERNNPGKKWEGGR